MAVRLFVLQCHYRKPVDFTDEALEAATNGWHTLQEGLLFGWNYGEKLGWNLDSAPLSPDANDLTQKFQASVDDDFNFAEGLAILFELAKDLRRAGNLLVHQGSTDVSADILWQQWQTLVSLAGVLGLEAKLRILPEISQNDLTDAEIEDLIQQRVEARKQKNFAESDRLRDELKAQGITLIDQADGGTKWHR